jgi:hypothetical protein
MSSSFAHFASNPRLLSFAVATAIGKEASRRAIRTANEITLVATDVLNIANRLS